MKRYTNWPFFLTFCLSFLITPLTSLATPPELLHAYALRHPGLSRPEAPLEALKVQWNAFLSEGLQAFGHLFQGSLLSDDAQSFKKGSKNLREQANEVKEKLYPWLEAYGTGTLPSRLEPLKKRTFTRDKNSFLEGFFAYTLCISFGMDGILHNQVAKQNADYFLSTDISCKNFKKASPALQKYHDMVATLTKSCLEILAHYDKTLKLDRILAEGTVIGLPNNPQGIAIIASSSASPFCVPIVTNLPFYSVDCHFGYEESPFLGPQLCVAAFKDHLVDEAGIRIIYDPMGNFHYPFNATFVYPLAPGLLHSTEVRHKIIRGGFPSIDQAFSEALNKNLLSKSLFIPMPTSLQDTLVFNLLALEALGEKENRPSSEIFIQGKSLETLTLELEEAFLQQEMAAENPVGNFLELPSLSEAHLEPPQEKRDESHETDLAIRASALSLTNQDTSGITQDSSVLSPFAEEAALKKVSSHKKKAASKPAKGKGKKAASHKSPLASKPKDPAFETPESPRAKAQKKLDELKLSGRTKWRSLLKIINSLDLSEVIAKQLPRYDGSHITLHQEGHPSLTLVKPHGGKDAAVPEKIYKSFFLEVLERSFKSAEG